AVRLVQAMPGVERVRDRLNLANNDGITPVQAETKPAFPPTPNILGTKPPESAPAPAAGPAAGQQFVEPMPMYQMPMPSAYDLNQPKMPPYAWPTYAPYNNYSRVASPELYPYQS